MGNVRSKKQNARIDFTSTVSIAFLLIIFFMLTSAMSKPQVMNLGLPNQCNDCGEQWSGGCSSGIETRTMTILLGANDKLICYTGFLEIPISAPKNMQYGKNGIRKELLDKAKSIRDYYKSIGTNKDIIVIIKPSKESKYKNLVDILDEMNIVGIETYAVINDFSPEEIKLLKSNSPSINN